VLIIEDDPDPRQFPRTLLASMGCSCTSVQTAQEVVSAVADDNFDAVLVDLGHSAEPRERLAFIIEKIPPSLRKRTLVITRDPLDAKVGELLRQRSVSNLAQGRLVHGLWDALQGIFAAPWFEASVLRNVRVAEIIFDSFMQRLPAGVRGSSGLSRRLSYRHENTIVYLSLEQLAGLNRIELVGELMDYATDQGQLENFPVVVTGESGPVARARTNRFGEFALEFNPKEGVELEIWTHHDSWLVVPLPDMTWAEGPFQ
jgi:hypothetical protein